MDVYKLLSRSTKLSTNPRNENSPSAKLPSCGISGDPQLFHNVVPDSRGKKRKRGIEKPTEEKTMEDEEEVNFFATKVEAVQPREKSAEYTKQEAPQLLDNEQCRKILRSHRIKVILLKSGKREDKASKTKMKKGMDISKKVNAKEEHQQIFPQPLTSFIELRSSYGISNRLAENLANQGYKIPTEVQMASLPLLLQPQIALRDYAEKVGGSDINILAVAPTGSGKTLAFLIPTFNKIIQRRRQDRDTREHILDAVIVAPTKELADQIVREAKKLSIGTGVKVSGMRKGMRIAEVDEDSMESLSSEGEEDLNESSPKNVSENPITKSDVLITTPGLFLGALATKKSSSFLTLPTVSTLVLDEADILLDPLFREQTLSIWSALTCPNLSVSLWSATISSSIESLALSTICTRSISLPRPLIRIVIGLKDSALPTISHSLTYCATESGKLLALRNLLHVPSSNPSNSIQVLRPPIITFTQTIPRAAALYAELLYDIPPIAGGSSRIAVLHSSLSNTARAAILERFRLGEIWILVTTDLLSRGMDFRGVNAVVNYDIPNDAAAYIHRVGRTGRAGREGGVAVTFYTREDIPYIRGVVNVIEASRKAAGKSEGKSFGKDYEWLLKLLPKTSKEEKKKLKVKGVEARRTDVSDTRNTSDEKGKNSSSRKPNTRIGTKSGYERKLKNRKIGAIQGSQRRAFCNTNSDAIVDTELDLETAESEWSGIDE